MKEYEYHDQSQGLSYLILEKTHFLLKRRILIKFFLRDCACIQITKQCTCIYDISNLIVSVKGCFKKKTLAINYILQASYLAVSRILLSRKRYHKLHTLQTKGTYIIFACCTAI